jgi:ethanolamine utilization protein EutA (predicted chaperonin)
MISASTMDFGNAKHTNVVFDNGPKMISLNCDNSGGRLTTQSRSDLRLLFTHPLDGGVVDVTSQVFGGEEEDVVRATLDSMERAMKWLRRTNWGL